MPVHSHVIKRFRNCSCRQRKKSILSQPLSVGIIVRFLLVRLRSKFDLIDLSRKSHNALNSPRSQLDSALLRLIATFVANIFHSSHEIKHANGKASARERFKLISWRF
jgi:hypothetical protein